MRMMARPGSILFMPPASEDDSPFGREKCQLCLSEKMESIDHVWSCPALAVERAVLKSNLSRLLTDLRLPFASKKIPSQEDKFCHEASMKVKQFIRNNSRFLSHDRAVRLARDFWKSNESKSTISKASFRAGISALLHSCGFQQLATIPNNLQRIFQRNLSLSVEANRSSLGRSDLFDEYCSSNQHDQSFGSLGSFWEVNLIGKNMLLVFGEKDFKVIQQGLLDRVSLLVNSKRPTRILLIAPSSSLPEKLPRTILKVASISSGLPMIRPADVVGSSISTSMPFTVLLALNKESMSIDPIDWEKFRSEVLAWAENSCPNFQINSVTDNLFSERTPLRHPPRAAMSPVWSGVYRFFDPESRPRNETNHLLSCGVPLEQAKLINRINNHDRNLSLIGVLPNQLRYLMKKECKEDKNRAFEAISKELFWNGYRLWNKRKKLMSRFWKNIAPEEWKLHGKIKEKKKKLFDPKDCSNPFHFLDKHSNLSRMRPTPCLCSKIVRKKQPLLFADLRKFSITQRNYLYISREDLIRGAHDRGKIRTS